MMIMMTHLGTCLRSSKAFTAHRLLPVSALEQLIYELRHVLSAVVIRWKKTVLSGDGT